jgi:hypothetical protein
MASVSSYQKAVSGINLIKLSMCAGYLVLLAGDVSLNPGPFTEIGNNEQCPSCSKVIRKNQPRLQCRLCELNCHLKCLGTDSNLTNYCQGCSVHNFETTDGIAETPGAGCTKGG